MRDKKKLLIVIVPAIAIAAGLLFYQKSIHKPDITSYQDTNGAFYECSKSIAAKKAMIPHIGSTSEGLVPLDQNEAIKYCHMTGIE